MSDDTNQPTRTYLPGLISRSNPTVRLDEMARKPQPRYIGELDELSQSIAGPPVQVRIPVRQVQETKAALQKLQRTIHECLYVLENPDGLRPSRSDNAERLALGVVRYRIKLVSQEISRVKRVRV